MRSPARIALLLTLTLTATACLGGSKRARRFERKQVQAFLKTLETPGLVVGEFPLKRDAVIDGDTIKVAGLESTLRLLAIDTEETFKKEEEKRLYSQGFNTYLLTHKKKSKKPVKIATPLGEDAKVFAEKFFEGVDIVRIERDHPKELRGLFNRYLAYVFVKKNGVWVNYNLECVRAGMSPYFAKYSYSRRFHDQFMAAQEEARAAGRGIWAKGAEAYDDYPERLKWWNARGDFIRDFEKEAETNDNFIVLTHWDSLRRLEERMGQEVTLLGTVGRITLGDGKRPTKAELSRRIGSNFPLVFFDRDVFGASNIARFKGEYVRVTGRVTKYHNKRRGTDVLQMVISLPGQVVGNENVPNYTGWDLEGQASNQEVSK